MHMRIVSALVVACGLLPAVLAAQTVRARGQVRPLQVGVPFAGAAISAPEAGVDVCARPDGRFAVVLPADMDVALRITPVGFDPYDVTVRPSTDTAVLPLGEHVIELEGLTVVGLALEGRGAAAWAQTELPGGDMTRAPGTLTEALQGRVAGARSTSGAPGGSVRIDLRGVRSLLGRTEPLVVMDGVVLSTVRIAPDDGITGATEAERDVLSRLADLNPADIERIDVVQGAAASARYGPRAGNGVIAITTRRGRVAPAAPAAALRCFRPAP